MTEETRPDDSVEMISQKSVDEDYKQMCWASRRGMLELDLILEPFVRDHYRDMGADEKLGYRRLMECQDQELFAWFLKREAPDNPELASTVQRILGSRE